MIPKGGLTGLHFCLPGSTIFAKVYLLVCLEPNCLHKFIFWSAWIHTVCKGIHFCLPRSTLFAKVYILVCQDPHGLQRFTFWSASIHTVCKAYSLVCQDPHCLQSFPFCLPGSSVCNGLHFGLLQSTLFAKVYILACLDLHCLQRFTWSAKIHSLQRFTFWSVWIHTVCKGLHFGLPGSTLVAKVYILVWLNPYWLQRFTFGLPGSTMFAKCLHFVYQDLHCLQKFTFWSARIHSVCKGLHFSLPGSILTAWVYILVCQDLNSLHMF